MAKIRAPKGVNTKKGAKRSSFPEIYAGPNPCGLTNFGITPLVKKSNAKVFKRGTDGNPLAYKSSGRKGGGQRRDSKGRFA
jgi:hypothetical protein